MKTKVYQTKTQKRPTTPAARPMAAKPAPAKIRLPDTPRSLFARAERLAKEGFHPDGTPDFLYQKGRWQDLSKAASMLGIDAGPEPRGRGKDLVAQYQAEADRLTPIVRDALASGTPVSAAPATATKATTTPSTKSTPAPRTASGKFATRERIASLPDSVQRANEYSRNRIAVIEGDVALNGCRTWAERYRAESDPILAGKIWEEHADDIIEGR